MVTGKEIILTQAS